MIYSASLRSSSMVATARTTRETSITAMIHMWAAPFGKVIDCSAGGSEGCGCRFEQIWEVALDAGMNLGADCDDAVASVLLLIRQRGVDEKGGEPRHETVNTTPQTEKKP